MTCIKIRVYDIEKKVKTTEKFMYPHFETINWFASQKLLQNIMQVNSEDQKCPANLLGGLKALLPLLKQWNSDKDVSIRSLIIEINFFFAIDYNIIITIYFLVQYKHPRSNSHHNECS